MNAYDDLLRARMGDNDIIYVTPEEMRAIIAEMPVRYDPKPTPPIKTSGSARGLFYCRTYVEYNHHAPEYLRELEEWHVRQEAYAKRKASGVIEFAGPTKDYEIRIKE